MLTTDTIVLSLQPHSDKAHILHAYTREHGRINYMVYGIGKKNAVALYHPLNLLRITANHSNNKPNVLKTAELRYIPQTTTTHPYKQTIALFISEILYNTLQHPMEDESMFQYIEQAIIALDNSTEPQDFHLQFLIGFAQQLGFAIDSQSAPQLLITPQSRAQRQTQIRLLCQYLQEHIENWKSPRSLDILIEIFD